MPTRLYSSLAFRNIIQHSISETTAIWKEPLACTRVQADLFMIILREADAELSPTRKLVGRDNLGPLQCTLLELLCLLGWDRPE